MGSEKKDRDFSPGQDSFDGSINNTSILDSKINYDESEIFNFNNPSVRDVTNAGVGGGIGYIGGAFSHMTSKNFAFNSNNFNLMRTSGRSWSVGVFTCSFLKTKYDNRKKKE